jgi:hypothetical protein
MNNEDPSFGDAIPDKTEEGIALLGAPLRGEIAGGHYDEERGRALNRAHDFRRKRPVAVEVLVDPNPEILGAQALPQVGVQMTDQCADPRCLALIVEVSVTHEYVMITVGYECHSQESLTIVGNIDDLTDGCCQVLKPTARCDSSRADPKLYVGSSGV